MTKCMTKTILKMTCSNDKDGSSVVECLTLDRGVAVLASLAACLESLSKTH